MQQQPRRAFLDVPPLSGVSGTVRLPGSKSISNRVLLLAALSAGTTAVHGLLDSDDTAVMLDALAALGCDLRRDGEVLHVGGIGGVLRVHEASLFLGNAGTAMRPLAATLAVLAALQGGRFSLHGVPRMHERPIRDLVAALRGLGCTVDELGTPGYPPLRVSGSAGGRLATAQQPVRVRGDVSSQFLTALLLALPLAGAGVTVEVDGELISKPYVELTLNLLARFGVAVQRDGWQRFTVPAGSRYASPGAIHVEGDASAASYFIAAGAIAAHGGAPLRIAGVGSDSIQGDVRFADAAAAMGARVRRSANAIDVQRGAWPLRAATIDGNDFPDAAMTLTALALFADGPTRVTNIASWRVKETDRIAALATELRKLGAGVVEGADAIEVSPPLTWRPAAIDTYDDHRIAMCLSLAAFNGRVPVRINDPGCVAKTFPGYFDALFGVAQARTDDVPVIAIDGPTASGKGTLAAAVADALGYHLLDSGALYRATGLAAQWDGAALDDEARIAALAGVLDLRFGHGPEGSRTWLRGTEVSTDLRLESAGLIASRVSALPAVRRALQGLQLAFRRAPGLVADGRDMGTVVFPDAALKVFLTASAAQRAERRHRQLLAKGIPATIEGLRADLEERDLRDRSRPVAPLVPAQDALLLDNSHLSIERSLEQVLAWWAERRPFQMS